MKGAETSGFNPSLQPIRLKSTFSFSLWATAPTLAVSVPAVKAANGGAVHCGCFPSEETAVLLMRGTGELAECSDERLQSDMDSCFIHVSYIPTLKALMALRAAEVQSDSIILHSILRRLIEAERTQKSKG